MPSSLGQRPAHQAADHQAVDLLRALWPKDLDPITDQQAQSLAAYLDLLNQWNRVHSLTAVRDLGEQVSRHLLDGLVAWGALTRRFGKNPALRIADVGCGMGVPGIIWAVVMPQSQFDLIERQQKKAAFLSHVVARLGLSTRVRVVAQDVRDWQPREAYQLICSRAFAALEDFVQLTWHLSLPGTEWAAMIGKASGIDVKDGSEQTLFSGKSLKLVELLKLSVPGTNAQRHLVWLQRLG